MKDMFRRRRHESHHEEPKHEDHKKEEPVVEDKLSEEHKTDQTTPDFDSHEHHEPHHEHENRETPTFVTEIIGDETHTPPLSSSTSQPIGDAPQGETAQNFSVSEAAHLSDQNNDLKDALFYDEGSKATRSFSAPVLIALCVILAGVSVYLGMKNRDLEGEVDQNKRELLKNTENKKDQQTIEAVAKRLGLSNTSQALVATVMNPGELKNLSSIFKESQDGDKLVLIGKQAILYRPNDDRIVASGSVSLQATGTATPSASVSEPKLTKPKFTLRNGTTINGLTKKYEPTLKKTIPEATIVRRENAKNQTVERTFIVDLSGKHADQVEEIAEDLEIEVDELPSVETKPADSDFLIILGLDADQ